jgi:hypothetical protein
MAHGGGQGLGDGRVWFAESAGNRIAWLEFAPR